MINRFVFSVFVIILRVRLEMSNYVSAIMEEVSLLRVRLVFLRVGLNVSSGFGLVSLFLFVLSFTILP